MKAYPHIPPEEYPTFDDFDMNRDGLVTFQEWQEYLYVVFHQYSKNSKKYL